MNYDFHPELAPWVPLLGALDYSDLPAARSEMRRIAALQPNYEPVGPVSAVDATAPGPIDAPDVRLRIYRPGGRNEPLPGLLYLHWGGFVFGNLDSIHATAMRIADRVSAVVVSVEYRSNRSRRGVRLQRHVGRPQR